MELVPGFLQGITRVLISYPFDYVRTHLQAQNGTSVRSYIQTHNLTIRGAYRGCSLQLVSVPVDRSIQFLLFERISKHQPIVVASIASSLISSLYSVPINYLTTRIINSHSSLTLTAVKTFIKDKTYYKGFSADIIKSFLGSVLYTTTYGSLRQHVPIDDHNYFMFGVLSSTASWSVIYPFDTLRVIKQTTPLDYYTILKTTPLRYLYAGFSIILLRSIPSAGCGMMVYETSRKLLL
jgi:hypothetical protein